MPLSSCALWYWALLMGAVHHQVIDVLLECLVVCIFQPAWGVLEHTSNVILKALPVDPMDRQNMTPEVRGNKYRELHVPHVPRETEDFIYLSKTLLVILIALRKPRGERRE